MVDPIREFTNGSTLFVPTEVLASNSRNYEYRFACRDQLDEALQRYHLQRADEIGAAHAPPKPSHVMQTKFCKVKNAGRDVHGTYKSQDRDVETQVSRQRNHINMRALSTMEVERLIAGSIGCCKSSSSSFSKSSEQHQIQGEESAESVAQNSMNVDYHTDLDHIQAMHREVCEELKRTCNLKINVKRQISKNESNMSLTEERSTSSVTKNSATSQWTTNLSSKSSSIFDKDQPQVFVSNDLKHKTISAASLVSISDKCLDPGAIFEKRIDNNVASSISSVNINTVPLPPPHDNETELYDVSYGLKSSENDISWVKIDTGTMSSIDDKQYDILGIPYVLNTEKIATLSPASSISYNNHTNTEFEISKIVRLPENKASSVTIPERYEQFEQHDVCTEHYPQMHAKWVEVINNGELSQKIRIEILKQTNSFRPENTLKDSVLYNNAQTRKKRYKSGIHSQYIKSSTKTRASMQNFFDNFRSEVIEEPFFLDTEKATALEMDVCSLRDTSSLIRYTEPPAAMIDVVKEYDDLNDEPQKLKLYIGDLTIQEDASGVELPKKSVNQNGNRMPQTQTQVESNVVPKGKAQCLVKRRAIRYMANKAYNNNKPFINTPNAPTPAPSPMPMLRSKRSHPHARPILPVNATLPSMSAQSADISVTGWRSRHKVKSLVGSKSIEDLKAKKSLLYNKMAITQERIIKTMDWIRSSLLQMEIPDCDYEKSKRQRNALEFYVRFLRNFLYPLKNMIDDFQVMPAEVFNSAVSNEACYSVSAIYTLIYQSLLAYQRQLRYFLLLDEVPQKLSPLIEMIYMTTTICLEKDLFDHQDSIMKCLQDRCIKFLGFIECMQEEDFMQARKHYGKQQNHAKYTVKMCLNDYKMYEPKLLRKNQGSKQKPTQRKAARKSFRKPQSTPDTVILQQQEAVSEPDMAITSEDVRTQIEDINDEFSKIFLPHLLSNNREQDQDLQYATAFSNNMTNSSSKMTAEAKLSNLKPLTLAVTEAHQHVAKEQVRQALEPIVNSLSNLMNKKYRKSLSNYYRNSKFI